MKRSIQLHYINYWKVIMPTSFPDIHILNVNVCFNDSLMEHNTAAVCGTWWRADINVDGIRGDMGYMK